MTREKYYITTAIDYPNANPHMGHAYEKIISDVYARWARLSGKKVFFLTGLDEHGQKLQIAAQNENMSPKEFVDRKAEIYKEFCKKLNISNDGFIRTSDDQHHKIATDIFQKVLDKGDIYKGQYEGHYCVPCETYWTEKQLVNNVCPNCKRPTTLLQEPSYFFKMGKYQEQLLKYFEENPKFIQPETRKNEILSRLKEPLRDLSVSRASFDWGIQLPNDETHVIYVWFDALINYISGLDGLRDEFWPPDVHVIGKDIIWFHTVIWPCMLFAAGITPPKKVYVHGFINDAHGEKMSKSKGNVVDPIEMETTYGADVLRYYFARNVPSGQDGNFSERDLILRYNNELANDLGNLLMRVSKLTLKNFDGRLKNEGFENELDHRQVFAEADELMKTYEHNRALDRIWTLINNTNAYINKNEPWKITDEKQLAKVLYNVLESIKNIAVLLSPFMPSTAEKILSRIGAKSCSFAELEFGKMEYFVQESEALFPKKEELPEQKQTFPIDLRVAKILSVEDHPDAEKLYVLKIDLGTEQRQLVAGLKKYYSKEELQDRNVVVVANLKPAKLRGIESNGMLLAAEEGEVVGLLSVPNSRPGDQVLPEDHELTSEPEIDFKKFMKYPMKTTKEGVVYKDYLLKTPKEDVKAERVGAGALVG